MYPHSLPGWTTKIEEVYNGVLKVTLTDKHGRRAEITGIDNNETIVRAVSDAFDIEKQFSKSWSNFLYNFCLSMLAEHVTTSDSHNYKNAGSWRIEVGDKRFLFLNRESWLISQNKSGDNWFDNEVIKDNELTYQIIVLYLNYMKS